MKQPKLRFSGYIEKYEKVKLSDISDIFDGTHSTPKYVSQGIKFISVENINNLLESNKFITKKAYDKYKIKPRRNDIFMTRIGDIGTSSILESDEPIAYYVSLALIRPNEKVSPKYLNQYIKTPYFQRELNNRTIHIAFPKKINLGEIGKCLATIPSLDEQRHIADFLSTVDRRIDLQRRLVDETRRLKTSVSQMLFSQKVRFIDDDGTEFPEWETGELEKYITSEGGSPLEKFVKKEGNFKFISIGNYTPNGKYYDNGSRIILNEITKAKMLNKNDLVMILNDKTFTGEIIGSTILIEKDNEYIYNQRSQKIICKQHVLPEFLWFLLNSQLFKKEILKRVQGGTQIYINFKAIEKIKVSIPILKEQRKISDLLLNIDKKIENEEQKLLELENLKKGLLQQMFV